MILGGFFFQAEDGIRDRDVTGVQTLKLDYVTAYALIGLSLVIGTPFFLVFGWLSDRIGRLKIILAGCLIAAVTYFPLFGALTHYANPALETFQQKNPITVYADQSTCNFHIFVGPWSKFSDCDRAQDFLTKSGLSFKSVNAPGQPVAVSIGSSKVEGWDSAKWQAALTGAGYPKAADPSQINYVMVELILVIMVLYVTMVYGPIAAFLVEMFPTKIRYTSMSLPYHIGNGVFGGLVPITGLTLIKSTGNNFAGLWYPMAIAAICAVVCYFRVPETSHVDIESGSISSVREAAPAPAAD